MPESIADKHIDVSMQKRGLCSSSTPMSVNEFLLISVHRYGNSKEHMTVAELKMFLKTEQKVYNGHFTRLPSTSVHNKYLLTSIITLLCAVLSPNWMS